MAASRSLLTEASPTSAEPIPLLAHAVGGSIGSALALLLLYPLERARIEIQASTAASTTSRRSTEARPDRIPSRGEASSSSLFLSAHQDFDDEPEPRGSSPSADSWTTTGSANEAEPDDAASPSSLQQVQQKLDLISCLQQVWVKGELYKGVTPIVATLGISNFVFYFLNEWMKRIVLRPTDTAPTTSSKHRRPSPYLSLIASSLAGICNVLLTNPLWVTNLSIVAGNSETNSLFSELARIASRDGLVSLWKGTATSILLVSNPVIQFFLYEQIKSQRAKNKSYLSPGEAFCWGALTKAVATIVTYPLQLTQAVLRLQPQAPEPCDTEKHNDEQESATAVAVPSPVPPQTPRYYYQGTLDCLIKLYRYQGIAGLYTGMRAKLLQTVLTAAFTFLTYEQILHAVYAAHQSLAGRRRTGIT